jgi:hypothetical protein
MVASILSTASLDPASSSQAAKRAATHIQPKGKITELALMTVITVKVTLQAVLTVATVPKHQKMTAAPAQGTSATRLDITIPKMNNHSNMNAVLPVRIAIRVKLKVASMTKSSKAGGNSSHAPGILKS